VSTDHPTTRPCAAGPACPALREIWRDGQLCRLRCDECGWSCTAPSIRYPARGTAIVLPPALLLRDRRAKVVQ